MADAATLIEAAGRAYDVLYTHWQTNNLKLRLTNFTLQLGSVFSDGVPGDRTVGNWLVVGIGIANGLTVLGVPLSDLNVAVNYVYRICWAAHAMSTSVPAIITPAQAAQVLLKYNANFTP